MVVVDDDIALPDLPQPRGVAGTLFVHKIAGALAEQGASLETVTAAAQTVIEKVASLGTSLDTCTVPGSPKENRIPSGKAELGLGIHGEPGVEHVPFIGADDAMMRVLEKLRDQKTSKDCVVLLNNLGSTTPLEMAVLSHTIAASGIANHVIGPAADDDIIGHARIFSFNSACRRQGVGSPVGTCPDGPRGLACSPSPKFLPRPLSPTVLHQLLQFHRKMRAPRSPWSILLIC